MLTIISKLIYDVIMHCQWRGSLVAVDQRKNVLDLYTLRHKEATDEWTFDQQQLHDAEEDLVLDNDDGDSCIKACKVVLDTKRGIKNIFIACFQKLLNSSSGHPTTDYSVNLFTYSPSKGCMCSYGESRIHPPTSAQVDIAGCSVSILDGPIVVWAEGRQLHFIYTVENSHEMLRRMYDLVTFLLPGYCFVEVCDMWPFLWAEEKDTFSGECSSLVVVFLKFKVMSDSTSTITEWVCLQVMLHSQGFDVKLHGEADLIPRDYGRLSTCVALHKSFGADLLSGDIACKRQFLVGTEYCQVVLLHCGTVLHCVTLSCIPVAIAVLDSQYCQLSFACQGDSGEVFAYHIGDEAEIQECGEWQGVREMVVGDFAHLGREQLLILFTDSAASFVVTDLEQFSTTTETKQSNGDGESRHGQQCAESLVGVVNALQLRKHNGEAYLTSIKTELQLKMELLKRSLSLLKSLEQEQRIEQGESSQETNSVPTLHSDPSLVCIIPGEAGIPGQPSSMKPDALPVSPPHPQPPLKLMRQWQRLKNDLWVIGALVQNLSSEKLIEVRFSIALLNNEGQSRTLDSSSRVVWIERCQAAASSMLSLSSSPTDSSPPAKRRKVEEPLNDLLEGLIKDRRKHQRSDRLTTLLPGMKLAVILSTAVPSFSNCEGDCSESVAILATWKKVEEEKYCEYKSLEEVNGIGVASLSFQLLSSGELNLDESCLCLWNGTATLPEKTNFEQRSSQDLACVLGIASLVQVEAKSDCTNCLNLAAMLRACLPLKSEAIISNDTQTNGSHGEFTDGAVLGDRSTIHLLEAVGGALVHVSSLQVNSARMAVLFKSFHQLSLLLVSVRRGLPLDVNLEILTGSSWCVSLKASLTSLVEEAEMKCNSVGHGMSRSSESGWLKEEEEDKRLLDELRDRTDLRMSMIPQ